VSFTVPVRLAPVAMLVEISLVEPSPLCPDPSHEKWREEEERAQDPPSLSLLFLHVADRVTSPAPTHRAPSRRQKPSSTRARPPHTVLLIARCQGPRTGELLDAVALVSLAYIKPLRAHDRTPLTPS
jgi:hypothetical protein